MYQITAIMNLKQSNTNAQVYKAAVNALVVLKEPFVKPCKYRRIDGFCVRSNGQCPATIFNLSINK